MSTLFCLISVDDINYKVTIQLDNDRIVGTESDLRRALEMDPEPDFKQYDFSQSYFIFEIHDKSMNEYVAIDSETEIENMSKIRVKILDPTVIEPIEVPKTIDEDDLMFIELSDFKDDIELVELYAQAHVPDDEIIKLIDHPNVTAESFSVQNIKVKKQLVRSVITFQDFFKKPGTYHDAIWEDICVDIKNGLGLKVLGLIRNRRKELNFVRIVPGIVQKELVTLIGQYNRLLRMCQCLTAQLADRLWPLFKIFHKSLRIEYIYPERGPSLKIMQKEFDNAKKISGLND